MNKNRIDRRIFENIVPHSLANRIARNFAWTQHIGPHIAQLEKKDNILIRLHPHFYVTKPSN